MCGNRKSGIFVAAVFALLVLMLMLPPAARALPWDYDMYRQQSLKSNEVARAPVSGTVPLGYKPFTLSIEDAEKELKSPVPFTRNSVWSGQRIFNVNCVTCHGRAGDGKGPVGPQVGAPNLLIAPYKDRSDGRIFAVVHLGVRNMPRYGFKLSEQEHWDLVNYLRFLQGADVDGLERPK